MNIEETPSVPTLQRNAAMMSSTTRMRGLTLCRNNHPFHQQQQQQRPMMVPIMRSSRQYQQPTMAFFSTESSNNNNNNNNNNKKDDKKKNVGTGTKSLGQPPIKVRVPPSRVLARSKIPTPSSAPPVQDNPLAHLPAPKSLVRKGLDMLSWLARATLTFVVKLPGNIVFYAWNSTERKALLTQIQDTIKHEINHYWVGTKLLWADIRTSRALLGKTLGGSALTRRERRQLLRTVSDLFRLVPFSMFIVIPFMEFALPFALRIFPNLLPSTFQDSLKAEESMKRELQSRIAMAQFFQETLEELAKEQKRKATRRKEELIEAGVDLAKDGDDSIDKTENSAADMLEFLEKARSGEMMPPDIIIKYANYFKDDLHIDNMPRMQLINMCKYMGIHPYGSDTFLRFQLRHKMRVLKEDDQRILWEGIDSLTKMELREACQERGMRSTGLSKDAYKDLLQQWLDLSVSKNVPIALLIMSRTFFLREEMFQPKSPTDETDKSDANLTGLADAISGLDKEVVNEILLEVATSEEKQSDPTIRKLKLEVLTQQNELIREEEAAREAAAKKKEQEASESKKDGTQAEISSSTETTTATITDEKPTPQVESVSTGEMPTATNVTAVPVENEQEEERGISAEEMDALRQLVSDDPVEKERAELERIKAAMKKESEEDDTPSTEINQQAAFVEVSSANESIIDGVTAATTAEASKLDESPSQPQKASSSSTLPQDAGPPEMTIVETTIIQPDNTKDVDEQSDKEEDDPVVRRLKAKVESMVDKIEVQLSEATTKIGDQYKLLDRDGDGILTKEEVASVLSQYFKRKISLEQAMEICDQVDVNHDGIFTVDELLTWIQQNKLVKYVEEMRDHDMDLMMETQSIDQPSKEEPTTDKTEATN